MIKKNTALALFIILVVAVMLAAQQPTCIVPSQNALVKTASYAAVAGDSGRLIVMNCSSACTLTLPSIPQSPNWMIWVESIGSGQVTVSPNGLFLNGSSASLPISQSVGSGIMITTDGTNYFALSVSPLVNPIVSPNPLNFLVNLVFKGPNPYVDATAYGVRTVNPNAAPAISGVTCTTTSGLPTVTVSTASTFQNGDGIVCVNAGAANGLGAVSAPTVTPFNMRAGTGTGDGVAAPAGSTSFSYEVFACDLGGGCTAPSSTGTTTTGNALGAQTVTVTSATRANDTLTYNTSSQIGASVGAIAILSGFSNADNSAGFGGVWCLITTVSSGNFTCANTPLDTRLGAATASAGGGTATFFNYNKVTWTAVTGAPFRYFVCNGSGTLLGQARLPVNPKNSGFTDGTLEFDDFGATMMNKSASVVPWYVSNSNCSGSATNDNWVTTISSGAGSTTLTMSGSAPNSNGGGKTIRFDNTPNHIAAATANPGAPVELPFTLGSGAYVYNSVLDLSNNSFGPLLTPSGATFNDTVLMGANTNWYGDRIPGNGSNTQFQSNSIPFVFTSGTPGVFNTNGFGGVVRWIAFTGPDNGVTFLQDGGGGALGGTYTDDQFLTTADSNDYMGMAFVCRGGAGQSCAGAFDGKTLVFAGTQGMGSLSATPSFFCDNCGFFKIKDLMGSSRALAFLGGDGSGTGGGTFSIEHGDWQGGSTPFVLASAKFGSGVNVYLGISGGLELDTMGQPCVVSLPAVQSITLSGCFPSSGVPQVSGTRVPGNAVFAQNRDNTASLFSSAHDGTLDAGAGVNYLLNTTNGAIATGATYPIFISGTVPSLNSCAVSSGGSVTVASHPFQIVPVWQDGSQGIASNTCIAVTSSGNQTVTLNWTQIPGNPKSIFVYDALVRQSVGLTISGNATSVVITTEGFTGSVLAAIPLGGPTMLMPGAQGIATPQLTVAGTPFVSTTLPTISTHFNTSGDSISATSNASFLITVGTGTANSTGALTLPASLNGWNCMLTNKARAAHIQQTNDSQTSATFTNFGTTFSATNWTNGDVLYGSCFPR